MTLKLDSLFNLFPNQTVITDINYINNSNMFYFLLGKNILFKDKAGQIKCSDFGHTLDLKNLTQTFIQKQVYQTAISSISDTLKNNRIGKEPDTLIISSQFFSCSGLVNSIIDSIGKETNIQSDLEFAIRSEKLESGVYSLIDISENESYHYNFVIEGNTYSLLDKTKLDNNKLKQLLANKFPSTQTDALFNSLFNYSNVIKTNQFIETNGILEDDFESYNFFDTKTDFETILGTDIVLATFFNGLSYSIQDFINEHITDDRLLLIKSPLTGFHPVKPILNSNKKNRVVNELDFLYDSTVSDFIKCEKRNVGFELKCYPSNKKIVFPFSAWVLSETGNLSIELLNEDESFPINLIDLKENLSKTLFSINDKQLVKYFVEFDMDKCNNIHFKIETLDKKEFYYLINK